MPRDEKFAYASVHRRFITFTKKKKEKKNPQRIKYSKPRELVVISIIIFEGIIISRVQTRNNLFLISFIPKVSISS